MSKEKKICIDDSQVTRLMTDTAKLAKGIDKDICPTVREMYKEHVPKDVGISKAKKGKQKKKDEDGGSGDALEWVAKRIDRKLNVKGKIDEFLDKHF